MKLYDIVIIGAGPAGASAAKELISKGMTILMLDKGKDINRRKDLISGWFGQGVSEISRLDVKDTLLNDPTEIKKTIDELRPISKEKILKIKSFCPLSYASGKEISKYYWENVSGKLDITFESEVISIIQDGNYFRIKMYSNKEVFAKKCIIATGKYSFDWLQKISKPLGLTVKETKGKFGVRIEIPTFRIQEYLDKNNDFSMQEGNVFVEDCRVNSCVGEWEDSNIISSFGYVCHEKFKKTNMMVGFEDSLTNCVKNVKIINILNNDKIKKEHVREFLDGKSILHNISSFKEIKKMVSRIESIVEDFRECAMIYIPEVRFNGTINVDEHMQTNIKNLYCIGECTDKVNTTIGAIVSGKIVSKTILGEETC